MNIIVRFMRRVRIFFRRERFVRNWMRKWHSIASRREKELMAEGMTPKGAHYAAMRQFGNATKLKEQSHDVVAFQVETVGQDLRFAMRQGGKKSRTGVDRGADSCDGHGA